MPRTNLDAGLKGLRAQIMHVGLQVEDSLAKSLKAIETGNHASLRLIIEADESIDTLCATTWWPGLALAYGSTAYKR